MKLFRNPDRAHSAFADFFQEPVASANDIADTRRRTNWIRLPFVRKVEGSRVGQSTGSIVQAQECFNASAQLGIASALGIQHLGAIRRILSFNGRNKDGLYAIGVERHEGS